MPRLVPYQASYLDAFIEWRNQPASVRHNPLKDMTRMEIALERELEGSDLEQFEFHENFRWFIELEDGAIVGTVSLRNINRQMNHAELGYGVDEAYYGQGIATAAVGLLIDMCFRQTPLRKLMGVRTRPERRVATGDGEARGSPKKDCCASTSSSTASRRMKWRTGC